MGEREFVTGRRRFVLIVPIVLALGASLLATPAPAAEPCTDPPEVFPVDELEEGMTGTAWTVVEGRTPAPMDVEILGVQPDGIAPGIDFILVQLSGPVIDETGGIAFGMSGSPVYIDDRLVGALAYGFFAADHTVAGVTPAQPMIDILSYPGTVPAHQAARVKLSEEMQESAGRAAGTSSFPGSARQLLVPVGVSGLGDRGIDTVQRAIDQAELPFVAYKSGSASVPVEPAATPLQPGESFAAALSYGDVTFAGIGTTTATCGDLAVAFGHPFFFQGPALWGMNGADIITTVKDPSSLYGPFKLGNVAELHGIVDQDRLAGIRGVEGLMPSLVPLTSFVQNPDIGKSRAGETSAVGQGDVPFLTLLAYLVNMDVVFDRIGDGSVILSWSIQGTKPSGASFSVDVREVYYSPWDASFESLMELWFQLELLAANPFKDIEFTGVDADATITQQRLESTITRVLTASSLRPALKERDVLKVARRDTIRMRVFLQPAEGGPEQSVDLMLPVRGKPSTGVLKVRGGKSGAFFDEEFFFEAALGDEEPESPVGNFGQLIEQLEGGERRSDLVARLSGKKLQVEKVKAQQDFIVRGTERIDIVVVG